MRDLLPTNRSGLDNAFTATAPLRALARLAHAAPGDNELVRPPLIDYEYLTYKGVGEGQRTGRAGMDRAKPSSSEKTRSMRAKTS